MASRRPTESSRTVETTPPAEKPKPPRSRSAGTRARKADAVSAAPPRIEISEEARRTMIAEGAYLRAERRGFSPGYEVEDWLAAEKEVDALLRAEHVGGSPQ